MPTIAGGVRCYRCKDKKKGCEAYSVVPRRPCQRCQDAGIAFEDCIPDTNPRPSNMTTPQATAGRSFTDNTTRFITNPSRRGTTVANVSYPTIAGASGLTETQRSADTSSSINHGTDDTNGYEDLATGPKPHRRLIDRPDPLDDTSVYASPAQNESSIPGRPHQSFSHAGTSKISSPSNDFAVSGADARCRTPKSGTAQEALLAVLNGTELSSPAVEEGRRQSLVSVEQPRQRHNGIETRNHIEDSQLGNQQKNQQAIITVPESRENQYRPGNMHSGVAVLNDEDVTSINPQLLLLNRDYDLPGNTYGSTPKWYSHNGYCDGCEQSLSDHAEFCPNVLLQKAKSLEFPQLLR